LAASIDGIYRTVRETHPVEDRSMPASEARMIANRANAARSTGPKTAEGKARSRENAVKHGLTGDGVVLSSEEAAEVERLRQSFESELQPSGEVGRTLVRRLALLAVRMDRCVIHESAALAEHVRLAEAEFDSEWPESELEGEDDADRERMRDLAARRALFDPSREATLARKYEAAAERGFFRALKELRQVEREAKADSTGPGIEAARSALGSFLTAAATVSSSVGKADGPDRSGVLVPPKVSNPVLNSRPKPIPALPVSPQTPLSGSFHVPFSIGRAH
jgi:hypothetical protein